MKVVHVHAPATPDAADDEGRAPEKKRKRPYAPPAIESAGGFAPITLGTKVPVLPGQGC
ncbi:MAG: hypothetical protein IT372_17470 [Polyangiaceae bacterium]|nr:hypothetical protein [Polyangiaceae bacterium]